MLQSSSTCSSRRTRCLTMSYHPGISIAKFLSTHKPVFLVAKGNQLILLGAPPEGNAAGIACGYARTTVIGMFGAFGKMKATSGNFPRCLKFSAMGILRQSVEASRSLLGRKRLPHTILRHYYESVQALDQRALSLPVPQSMSPYHCCRMLP